MIGRAWALEWKVALRRPRLLAWNVAVPFLLLAPVAASAAAAPHRAAVFTVFFVMFGVFGSCVPLVRDGASGWIEKLLLTGYPSRAWLAERVASGAALDVMQLLPTLLFLLVAVGAPLAHWPGAAAGLLLAVLVGNLLGAVVAAVVRSLAEGALVCAAATLLVLHVSGTFRTPPPGAWATLERLSPFMPLHEVLVALGPGGGGVHDGGWFLPLAVAAAACCGLLVVAPSLTRRLGSAAD